MGQVILLFTLTAYRNSLATSVELEQGPSFLQVASRPSSRHAHASQRRVVVNSTNAEVEQRMNLLGHEGGSSAVAGSTHLLSTQLVVNSTNAEVDQRMDLLGHEGGSSAVAGSTHLLSTQLCDDVPMCECVPRPNVNVAVKNSLPTRANGFSHVMRKLTDNEFCFPKRNTSCEDASLPVQVIMSRGGYVSRAQAGKILTGKRIVFIGDSTMRRAMFGLCSFFEQEPFPDRYGAPVYHDTLRCPDGIEVNKDPQATDSSTLENRQHYVDMWEEQGGIFKDKEMRRLNISLEFRWAPTPSKALGVLQDLRANDTFHGDLIMLGLFVHGLAENKYKKSRNLAKNAAGMLAGHRDIFGNYSKKGLPPMLVFTPNLVDGDQSETIDFNQVLVDSMQVMVNMSTPKAVSVVDSTSWMATAESKTQRHACLASVSEEQHSFERPLYSSHLESLYGSLLQVQFILQELRERIVHN